MSTDRYESRTVPQIRGTVIGALLDLLMWPWRLPFDVLERRRENRAFASGMEAAWAYCESIWDQPFVDAWCKLLQTPTRPYAPRSTLLLSRFLKTFPNGCDFLLARARSQNPVIAAYAVMCVPNPNELPLDILEREDVVTLRDWFHEVRMPLGAFAKMQIDGFNWYRDLDIDDSTPAGDRQ